jgi:hypothetical protein
MQPNTAIDVLQQGVRVTLGATSALVESIQDPLKREENLAQLRLNPNEFISVLAEKGTDAETEARQFVTGVVGQYTSGHTPTGHRPASTSPTVDIALQLELRELTAQLAELRSQLTQPRPEG